MEIKKEYNFKDLLNDCWSGAIDTLKTIAKNNKEAEFMELLNNSFVNIPTITEINDFLWFDDDFILNELNIETEV